MYNKAIHADEMRKDGDLRQAHRGFPRELLTIEGDILSTTNAMADYKHGMGL
jgi:hypothetical protein